jgi:hypothetical protein
VFTQRVPVAREWEAAVGPRLRADEDFACVA